jgi:hypothetical protein
MAQVYSVNVVGYVNLTIPSNFSLVANQLDNTPDNKISTLFPAPSLGTVFYKFDPISGFGSEQYVGSWPGGGSSTVMNPGEGAFIFNPGSAFTATFVGQVRTGSTDIAVPGSFSVVSSMFPQAGFLYDPSPGPNGDLGFGVPELGEVIYQFNNISGYGSSQWVGSWGTGAAIHGPSLAVGEAFFNFTPSATTHHWVRSFDVGTGFH